MVRTTTKTHVLAGQRAGSAPVARPRPELGGKGRALPNRRARPLRVVSQRFRREMRVSARPAVLALVLLTLLGTLLGMLYPTWAPSTVLLLPMFIASLWLGPRTLPWVIVFVCACFCILLVDQPVVSLRTIARAVVTFAIALLIMFTSFRRSRLGVSGPMGESMFVV